MVGCMCINYNLTEYLMFNKIVGEFCTTIDLDKEKLKDETETETFSSNVDEVLGNIIQKAIEKVGKPVSMMQKNDKLMVAKIVDEKGGFLIKGAIDKLAHSLNVSRYTIYNYLEESKVKKRKNKLEKQYNDSAL
jgi:predicted transcriptional regulator YheO